MTQIGMILRQMTARMALAAALALPSLAWSQSLPAESDLRALQYYNSQNQTDAVAAEIRRLQTAFPGWVPPIAIGQILKTGPTTEVDEIYGRIASGDLTGAHQALTNTRAKYPAWIPPDDLMAQLDLAHAQAGFDAAVAGANMQEMYRFAKQTPALLRCDRINNIWQLAELQAKAGNSAGAMMAYQQIMAACTNLPELTATMEKADAVASPNEMSDLFALALQRFPESTNAFTTLQTRLLAGHGAKRVVLKTTVAVTPSAEAPPIPALSNATISNLQLPRKGDGRLGATRTAAKAGNFTACIAQSSRPRSLDVAYERAWCAYNLDRPLEALAYFSAAASAKLGGTIPRDARYGMALSYLKKNMTDQASQLAATTDYTPEQRHTVETIILDQRGVRSYQQGRFKETIAFLDAKEVMDGSLRRDLAILRAYSFLNLGDKAQALHQFKLLDDALSTPETHAGLQASR